jgi:hypothetical protein
MSIVEHGLDIIMEVYKPFLQTWGICNSMMEPQMMKVMR